MIYRVKNEWNYVSLCGAGRYGFDFQNNGVTKDAASFDAAVAAFEKADTIAFTSSITNEEARITSYNVCYTKLLRICTKTLMIA